jgi:hypothetical protein
MFFKTDSIEYSQGSADDLPVAYSLTMPSLKEKVSTPGGLQINREWSGVSCFGNRDKMSQGSFSAKRNLTFKVMVDAKKGFQSI